MTPLAATNEELQRWRDEGLTLPVWWRDDDAIEPTPALDRLLAIATQFAAPVHLAVIPGTAKPELADRLRDTTGVFVLTHGWRHQNHAPPDQKKAEFGAHRPLPLMSGEIGSARQRLAELFGDLSLPVFTPPWNRVAPEVVGQLQGLGFRAISTFMPRGAQYALAGLLQVNTHLDPIAWKAGGGLLAPDFLDEHLTGHLRARRTGAADNREPYGLLTHHLVHDANVWDFAERLLETFAASGVTRWTPPLSEIRP
jgi:peptidoglycan/xylan/chitin deacetylase (PgdA/CDA1 family)